ncbi:MAG: polyprenyl synthetase family protein [Gaiellaceae bacterium]
MRQAEGLRDTVEVYLRSLTFAADLGALEPALRYSLESGGKRIRPVLCLAVAEAAGGDVERTLAAAAALELVHTFSLVHDDLPAMDDDAERRGRPSVHIAFGEGVALLAGDALLGEAMRLALSYEDPGIARELVDATLGMIGGQYRDITGDDDDLADLHRLKTGRLFAAAVGLGLRVSGIADQDQAAWRAFGAEIGLLFQIVDDILDGDGLAARLASDEVKQLASTAADRARKQLKVVSGDTNVLHELVDAVAFRTG